MGFWDLSDEDKRLHNEVFGIVAEECVGCGVWVPVDQIESGSEPYCKNCEEQLVCQDCGLSISAFDFTQTGLCSNCNNDSFLMDSDDFDDFPFQLMTTYYVCTNLINNAVCTSYTAINSTDLGGGGYITPQLAGIIIFYAFTINLVVFGFRSMRRQL